jgi:hypothetical protein
MRNSLTLIFAVLVGAAPFSALGHGPQIQLTNTNNQIVTRNLFLDEPYNTAPQPPSSAVSVYVMPLAPISAFGGTAYYAQPSSALAVSGPGIAWSYGWSYDTSAHTTFPSGSNFVETLVGGLQQWNGTSFVPSTNGAQLQIFKSATNFGVSGSANPSVALKAIAAPISATDTGHLDDHTSIQFQLLGDGIVPSASHVPAPVADGVYLSQLQLHLDHQPTTPDPNMPSYDPAHAIQDSAPFYFVTFKGVDSAAALGAAQSAFPGASIQVVPEPASFVLASTFVLALTRRRGAA